MTGIFRGTRRKVIATTLGFALLSGCGQQAEAPATVVASAGQVVISPARAASHYAAARFAQQVSFGPTPQLVAEIEQKGFAKWIDDQFALPASKIDTGPVRVYNSQIPEEGRRGFNYFVDQMFPSLIASPDQLRRRVTFAVSQFVTVSEKKIEPYGALTYSNFLQDNALGDYGSFLRLLSKHPPMGAYLDNVINRPTAPGCIGCAPNENYARELMQLFSIGVVMLNPDGSTVRTAANKPVETYTQDDVSEMARALTGWKMPNSPQYDYSRFDGQMTPESYASAHDFGAKKILGASFPAGRDAEAELTSVVDLLMAHPNTAPFISLRMIQHLVTSNPSPAYIARISAVFRNNGKNVVGDMKAVVKAILLDPEARRGDVPGADVPGFGKLREPVLWYTGLLRGLGCSRLLNRANGDRSFPYSQTPFSPSSVFSFYLPTDHAPGSNLLAPEQRLINSDELSVRMGSYGLAYDAVMSTSSCNVSESGQALARSPAEFADLASERFFNGAMSPTLRKTLLDLAPTIFGETVNNKAMGLLALVLTSPDYGVMK